MMLTSDSLYLDSNPYPYSIHSTHAASDESQLLRNAFDNEWYTAALIQAGYEKPPTVMQTYIEPLLDYHCPDPIRSYKIKIRVISKVKGQPVSYNEQCEDVL
jgi:hypothetical protein